MFLCSSIFNFVNVCKCLFLLLIDFFGTNFISSDAFISYRPCLYVHSTKQFLLIYVTSFKKSEVAEGILLYTFPANMHYSENKDTAQNKDLTKGHATNSNFKTDCLVILDPSDNITWTISWDYHSTVKGMRGAGDFHY